MGISVNENDPRVKRTRQLLLQAFYELAAEKEMHSISVQDITERATLNRATFYAHFRDKDALMDAALRSKFQAALAAKLSPSSPFAKGNLRLLFCVVCDFLNTTIRRCPRTPGEHHPLLKVAVQEELYAFVLHWLKQGLPIERSRRYSLETVATLLTWSLLGAAIEWSHNPTKQSQDAMAAQIVDLLTEGLGSTISTASSMEVSLRRGE